MLHVRRSFRSALHPQQSGLDGIPVEHRSTGARQPDGGNASLANRLAKSSFAEGDVLCERRAKSMNAGCAPCCGGCAGASRVTLTGSAMSELLIIPAPMGQAPYREKQATRGKALQMKALEKAMMSHGCPKAAPWSDRGNTPANGTARRCLRTPPPNLAPVAGDTRMAWGGHRPPL